MVWIDDERFSQIERTELENRQLRTIIKRQKRELNTQVGVIAIFLAMILVLVVFMLVRMT